MQRMTYRFNLVPLFRNMLDRDMKSQKNCQYYGDFYCHVTFITKDVWRQKKNGIEPSKENGSQNTKSYSLSYLIGKLLRNLTLGFRVIFNKIILESEQLKLFVLLTIIRLRSTSSFVVSSIYCLNEMLAVLYKEFAWSRVQREQYLTDEGHETVTTSRCHDNQSSLQLSYLALDIIMIKLVWQFALFGRHPCSIICSTLSVSEDLQYKLVFSILLTLKSHTTIPVWTSI